MCLSRAREEKEETSYFTFVYTTPIRKIVCMYV